MDLSIHYSNYHNSHILLYYRLEANKVKYARKYMPIRARRRLLDYQQAALTAYNVEQANTSEWPRQSGFKREMAAVRYHAQYRSI